MDKDLVMELKMLQQLRMASEVQKVFEGRSRALCLPSYGLSSGIETPDVAKHKRHGQSGSTAKHCCGTGGGSPPLCRLHEKVMLAMLVGVPSELN